LEAQYENGGWPQFYPLRKGYYTHITFNDNATINVLNLLKDLSNGNQKYDFVTDDVVLDRVEQALEKGIECILKTQFVQNGVLTVWCAQHDEITLLPAKARAYELPSLSGSESAGIVDFLMSLENPSPEIIKAVKAAVVWFDKVKITGYKVENFTNSEGKKDRRVVSDAGARPMWARFYDLENNRPFFCDRDGIKKYSLEEIGYERRNGYSWYSDSAQKILDNYAKWKKKWITEK
jgi:pectinesterase